MLLSSTKFRLTIIHSIQNRRLLVFDICGNCQPVSVSSILHVDYQTAGFTYSLYIVTDLCTKGTLKVMMRRCVILFTVSTVQVSRVSCRHLAMYSNQAWRVIDQIGTQRYNQCCTETSFMTNLASCTLQHRKQVDQYIT